MLRSRSIVKSLLCLGIFLVVVLKAAPAIAQEGIISSVYIAERTALQKMQAARKAGNEEEVQRLSAEIKELVNQKKSWANDLLTLTESSIAKIQNDNAPGLSDEQRASLLRRIEEKKSQKRLLELQLEENKFDYFIQVQKKREFIKEWENHLKSIHEYAAGEIKRLEEAVAGWQKDLERLSAEHAEELAKAEQSLQKQIEDAASVKEKQSSGKASATDVKNAEDAVASWQKTIADMRRNIAEGTYTSRAFNWANTRSFRENIKYSNETIGKIQKAVADGSYQHRYGFRYGLPTIAECNKVIADAVAEIAAMRDKYTAEDWGNRKELRLQIQNLNVEILKNQEEAGLKDEKLAALEARRHELEQFIYHDFLTELPKEDSGFIKAIKWISSAIEKVNEVTEKFERVKKLVDIVKNNSNPYNAVNYLLEETTGVSLNSRLAEKLLPEKVRENPLVKRLINGESINRQDILKELVVENLPHDVKLRVEQAVDLINTARSSNIRDLVAQHGFEQAMRVIDSQPELKKAFGAFKQAHNLIQNPAQLEEQLKDSIRERVELEFKVAGKEIVDSLVSEETKKRVEAYQEKLKKIEEDVTSGCRFAAEEVTRVALETVQKGIEECVGLRSESSEMVEEFVKSYKGPAAD